MSKENIYIYLVSIKKRMSWALESLHVYLTEIYHM